MKCKDTERMIPLFLSGQLNPKELDRFLTHIKKCEECEEELTIQYLVMIGTSLIEEGVSFNLKEAMKLLLEEADKKIKIWKILYGLSYIAEAAIVLTVILILVMVIIL